MSAMDGGHPSPRHDGNPEDEDADVETGLRHPADGGRREEARKHSGDDGPGDPTGLGVEVAGGKQRESAGARGDRPNRRRRSVGSAPHRSGGVEGVNCGEGRDAAGKQVDGPREGEGGGLTPGNGRDGAARHAQRVEPGGRSRGGGNRDEVPRRAGDRGGRTHGAAC